MRQETLESRLQVDQEKLKNRIQVDQENLEGRLIKYQDNNNNGLIIKLLATVVGGGAFAFGIAFSAFTLFGFEIHHPMRG